MKSFYSLAAFLVAFAYACMIANDIGKVMPEFVVGLNQVFVLIALTGGFFGLGYMAGKEDAK